MLYAVAQTGLIHSLGPSRPPTARWHKYSLFTSILDGMHYSTAQLSFVSELSLPLLLLNSV